MAVSACSLPKIPRPSTPRLIQKEILNETLLSTVKQVHMKSGYITNA